MGHPSPGRASNSTSPVRDWLVAVALCLAGLALWNAWQDESAPDDDVFDISEHYTPFTPTTITLDSP